MADTLTIPLTPEAAAKLRSMAADRGETVETLARHLLETATIDFGAPADSLLSAEHLADLQRRVDNPGPMASPERTAAVFRKFGIEP